MTTRARGAAALAGLALGTPLTLWLFAANPQSPRELRSRLALGLSPDRHGAEMLAGEDLLERGEAFFRIEEPSEAEAAEARRTLLEARQRFERAAARAGSAEDEARTRDAWARADLQLARWALLRGKGGGRLGTDDEDLFRWGLAYAREGLRIADPASSTAGRLSSIADELEDELSFWR